MALEFLQTEEGPLKLQLGEDEYNQMTEKEKMDLELAKDKGYITSEESELAGSKGTVPKEVETETVNEKEEIKTDDGKFSIDIRGALSNVGQGISAFVQDVGSNLSAIAQAVPQKLKKLPLILKRKKIL